jgi:hypothetical protein
MKWIGVVLGGLGALTAPLQARLGETEKRIEERYGNPVREPLLVQNWKVHRYEKSGLRIFVVFTKGASIYEVFSNVDQTPLGSHQIKSLLDANADGGTWLDYTPDDRKGKWWKLVNRPVYAKADSLRMGFEVFTQVFKEKLDALGGGFDPMRGF